MFWILDRTAKKTQYVTYTKVNWLLLFGEIIAVCSENCTKQLQNEELLVVEGAEKHS
jgi:hypothetical protein